MRWIWVCVFLFMFPAQAEAMNVVRLGKPASPSTDPRVVLSYSALTTTHQPIQITCQALPPGQNSFASFYSTTLKPGGNSGTCEYVFGGAGEYRFRVESNDGTDIVYSETVSVVSGSSSVSGISNWKSEKIGCQYKLSFDVPNDPSVARVELFRASSQTIFTNSSDKVFSSNVSPGQQLTHIDTPPSCDTYYYAARLVALSGSASGLAGDSVETQATLVVAPTPIATTTTTTAITRPNPSLVPAPVIPETIVEVTPLPSPITEPSSIPVEPTPEAGQVLGEQDQVRDHALATWILIGLTALGLTGISAGTMIWWLHRRG